MSYASQFHMPGAYHFDTPGAAGPALSAGIFRPPISPSASSSVLNLAKSTGSLYSDTSATSPAPNLRRKRTYDDAARESTPLAEWTSMNMENTLDLGSPMAVSESAETPGERTGGRVIRYTLAGQIETPGGAVGNPLEGDVEDSVYSDVDYRRALGPKGDPGDADPTSSRPLNLRTASAPQQPSSAENWSILNTLGGMVGKVWDFCRAGAFKGFHAGGGTGYDLRQASPRAAAPGIPNGKVWCNEHDVPTLQADEPTLHANGVPGGFPQSDYMPYVPEYHEMSTPEVTPQPAAKRRQVSEVGDELRRNWVMVEPDQQERERKRTSLASVPSTTPVRAGGRVQQRPSAGNRRISIPVSRLGGSPSLNRRTSSRISHAGSPNLTAREPASFAQPRSPVTASRPVYNSASRIPLLSQAPNPFARPSSPRPSSRQSSIPSPLNGAFPTGQGHRRSRSGASAASNSRRKTGLDADGIESSPRLDAEAKQLAARKLAVEKDTDARIEAFNARLREMIRQGKEALGTTVEVEVEGGQEGVWMDDD